SISFLFTYTTLFRSPVFCLVSLVLVFFLLKVPKQQEEPVPLRTFFKNIKAIFAKKGRWLYAIFIIGCILMYVLFGVLFYLSTILEENYQIEGILKGLILAIP